jgi:hypothetical protein
MDFVAGSEQGFPNDLPGGNDLRKSKVIRQFLFTVILVFILQTVMLTVIFGAFYKSSVTDIRDLGVSNMKSQASMVENYLSRGENVL